jgi:hypothetical protein
VLAAVESDSTNSRCYVMGNVLTQTYIEIRPPEHIIAIRRVYLKCKYHAYLIGSDNVNNRFFEEVAIKTRHAYVHLHGFFGYVKHRYVQSAAPEVVHEYVVHVGLLVQVVGHCCGRGLLEHAHDLNIHNNPYTNEQANG